VPKIHLENREKQSVGEDVAKCYAYRTTAPAASKGGVLVGWQLADIVPFLPTSLIPATYILYYEAFIMW
jgi:hypothetical protein